MFTKFGLLLEEKAVKKHGPSGAGESSPGGLPHRGKRVPHIPRAPDAQGRNNTLSNPKGGKPQP